MKTFLAIAATAIASYVIAQKYHIRIVNTKGKEIYCSPNYKKNNRNPHEDEEYGY